MKLLLAHKNENAVLEAFRYLSNLFATVQQKKGNSKCMIKNVEIQNSRLPVTMQGCLR